MSAVVGSIRWKEPITPPGQRYMIDRIITEFDVKKMKGPDIAVAHLQTPIIWNDYIRPVCFPVPGQQFVGTVTVSGWGRTPIDDRPNPNLLKLDYAIIPDESCSSSFTSYDPRSEICVGQLDGKGTCNVSLVDL